MEYLKPEVVEVPIAWTWDGVMPTDDFFEAAAKMGKNLAGREVVKEWKFLEIKDGIGYWSLEHVS